MKTVIFIVSLSLFFALVISQGPIQCSNCNCIQGGDSERFAVVK